LTFLGVTTIFSLIVEVNSGKHFFSENQDAAMKLLFFSQVATLLAYLYSKKVGEGGPIF
jgi:hypothetical protein